MCSFTSKCASIGTWRKSRLLNHKLQADLASASNNVWGLHEVNMLFGGHLISNIRPINSLGESSSHIPSGDAPKILNVG